MSHYAYYEFQALDRPLSPSDEDKLRSISTRARITSTSFVNDYSWGGFKGDVDAWMVKYFDAFLYIDNRGNRELKLRLPAQGLDLATVKAHCDGECVTVLERAGMVVLSMASEDEDADEWIAGEGRLASLIGLRNELTRGDLRALYLCWLLRAQIGELEDDELEPPIPDGLGELSAAQASLVEFLRIDPDLLHVVAEASLSMAASGLDPEAVRSWVGGLSTGEKNEALSRIILDANSAGFHEWLRRCMKECPAADNQSRTTSRTVGELLQASEERSTERRRLAAEKMAEEKAELDRVKARMREKILDHLTGSEPKLWEDVNILIATHQPASYRRAVGILVDLRDLAARGDGDEFRLRIDALHQLHARKPTFLELLKKAGF
jgi:hypothetical protein